MRSRYALAGRHPTPTVFALCAALAVAALLLGGCGLFSSEDDERAVATNTPRPVAGPIPTWTPVVTPTPEPSPTPDVVDVSNCDLGAIYVRDVTIPDGTKMKPGEAFTKTWEIKNTGSCPWGRGYWLVFVNNQQMGAPDRVPIPETAPGATTEVSVTLTAPAAVGEYRSDWQMQVNEDRRFGSSFYLVIVVEG